ncbi:MAG: ribonuclease H-like YkuK family protein [archaeon]
MMKKEWRTPTRGQFTLNDMCSEIKKFVKDNKNSIYKITIGTDCQEHNHYFKFVTAIVVHRLNKGAQYYFKIEKKKHINSLRQKIMHESILTLQYRELLNNKLSSFSKNYNIVIQPHVDIGENGPTKKFISEITGMFKGYGIEECAVIKPDSYAASSVANKHTK